MLNEDENVQNFWILESISVSFSIINQSIGFFIFDKIFDRVRSINITQKPILFVSLNSSLTQLLHFHCLVGVLPPARLETSDHLSRPPLSL